MNHRPTIDCVSTVLKTEKRDKRTPPFPPYTEQNNALVTSEELKCLKPCDGEGKGLRHGFSAQSSHLSV